MSSESRSRSPSLKASINECYSVWRKRRIDSSKEEEKEKREQKRSWKRLRNWIDSDDEEEKKSKKRSNNIKEEKKSRRCLKSKVESDEEEEAIGKKRKRRSNDIKDQKKTGRCLKRCIESDEEEGEKKKQHSSSFKEAVRSRSYEGRVNITGSEINRISPFPEEGSSQGRPCFESRRPLSLDITKYHFHYLLGTGGFAKVMLASTPKTRKLAAVKIIRKEPNNKSSIEKEARVLRAAVGHPFLCHVYAAFQSQLHAFFIMEYASGGSLHDIISERPYLEEREVIFYSAEMACGLQYLHSLGIIHRDIKPGNVLLSSKGHVKLADFGVAAEGVFGQNTIHGQVGTFNYMAPEVLRDQDYTAAVDWWSFGITLCKIATGKSPFLDGHDLPNVKKSILKHQPNIPGWISSELRNLLRKLLKKKAHKRLGIIGSIRQHPFYASIDWEALESMRIPPPFQPEPEAPEDLNEVMPSFMEVLQNPSEDNLIQELSFISPSWKE